MVARILLIFSVARVALAAPAVVRQRHLDLAKAASEKRAPGSDNGETGANLPPESSSRMPPHDHYTDGTDFWAWLTGPPRLGPPGSEPEWSSAQANQITTTQASGSTSSSDTSESSPLGSGDLPPPHQAAPEANRIFSDADKRKIFGVAGVIVGAVVIGIGIHQTIKHP